jgi:uncharacterized SAM-binding protein YcdF (DUF218 family)
MFVLKKILGAWMMPLPLCLTLAGLALLCRWRGRYRAATSFLLLSFSAALLTASQPVADLLIDPLESRYAVVLDTSRFAATGPVYIVVLGSGFRRNENLPITATIDETGLSRIVEGIRLFKQTPDSILVLSGGSVDGLNSAALGYRTLALEMGVPISSTLTFDEPTDTGEEIEVIRNRLGGKSILLVTSAFHMPRAVALAHRAGLSVVPAPTGHLSGGKEKWRWRKLVPSGSAIRKSELALHEYLGLAALRFGIS